MSFWGKEIYFMGGYQFYSEVPIELSFCLFLLVAEVMLEIFGREFWHVARRNVAHEVKLIEHIATQSQLLQVLYFYLNLFLGSNVAYPQVHDILALRGNLTISGLLSLLDSLCILSLSFFFLLNNSFNPSWTIASHKLINTGIIMNGESISEL